MALDNDTNKSVLSATSAIHSSVPELQNKRSHNFAVAYPHVVRPTPVWIADNAGISKKTSMASLTSSPEISSSAQHNSSSARDDISDEERGLLGLDRDDMSLADSQNLSPMPPAPSTPNSRGKIRVSDSPYTIYSYSSKNPDIPATTAHDLTAPYTSNYQLNTNPLKSQLRQSYVSPVNGANRWTPFVNATLNSDTADNGKIIEYDALNKQADLDGEWTGVGWDEDSRKSLASRKANWFSRLFQSRKKRLLLQDQNKKQSLDIRKPGRYFQSARAQYFVSDRWREEGKAKSKSALLNNPHIPSIFRGISFILSLISLSLACSVFVKSHKTFPTAQQQTSTIMTIACQTVALVYLVYITYDEYTGKPLGLRDAQVKMRLIMLDLLFIIFLSANLSLAFNAVYDSLWLCQAGDDNVSNLANHLSSVPYNATICTQQRVLASFLFLSLVSYISTFNISIFRLVERVVQ